jgi:polyphosphate kinase 2 (PPK2 family)
LSHSGAFGKLGFVGLGSIDNERGARAGLDYESALGALREQLGELQLPQIAYGRRAIILFEGPQGAGKKAALKQLAAAFDPCHCAIHCTLHDRREAAEGHWLARFWRELPVAGHTAIFFRSWYRRVLDDRLQGRIEDKALARAFDEINEFEAQQRDYGTLIVKLYFDVSADVQDARLRARSANPWQRVIRGDDESLSVRDAGYSTALAELRANTDTRWSPWRMIDGDDESRAALSALSAIADAWAEAMPAEPPKLVGAPIHAA